jgi:hypothetical protein
MPKELGVSVCACGLSGQKLSFSALTERSDGVSVSPDWQ